MEPPKLGRDSVHAEVWQVCQGLEGEVHRM